MSKKPIATGKSNFGLIDAEKLFDELERMFFSIRLVGMDSIPLLLRITSAMRVGYTRWTFGRKQAYAAFQENKLSIGNHISSAIWQGMELPADWQSE